MAVMVLCLCHCAELKSQDLYYEQYTQADGLPSMQTYEMLQDSNGILWVGTENGLVSYDGDSFTKYSHPDLLSDDIIEIMIGLDGYIYFLNLANQMGYLANGKVNLLELSEFEKKIRDIYTFQDKQYLLAQHQTTFSWELYSFRLLDNKRVEILPEKRSIKIHKNGEAMNVYANKGERTMRINGIEYKLIDGYFEGRGYAYNRLYKIEDGRCFFIQVASNSYEIDEVLFQKLMEGQCERMVNFRDMYYLIFKRGVVLYDSGTNRFSSLFEDIVVNTVFLDREGSLWVSTRSEGLFRVPNAIAQLDTRKRDLINDVSVQMIVESEDGNIYASTEFGDVYIFNKDKELLKKMNPSVHLRPMKLSKSKGSVYGGGQVVMFSIDTKTLKLETFKNKFFSIKCVLKDNATLYIGTGLGLYITTYDEFEALGYGNANILHNKWIRFLYDDAIRNRILIGTINELHYLDKDNPSSTKPISSDKNYSFMDIVEDGEGKIWVATENSGILLLDGDRLVEKYTITNGLNANNVRNLQVTGNQLLVNTIKGINSIDLLKDEIEDLGDLSGIAPDEILTFNQIDEEYWIGTKSGLTIIHKEQLNSISSSQPTLSLEGIFVNGTASSFRNNFELDHDSNTVVLNYRNITFNNRNNKSIKYKINGSTDWIYSTDPLVRLQSLKPGNYTIETVGLNGRQKESNTITTSFTVLPPWWHTGWARVLGLLLLVGLFQLILIIRARRIRKEESTKREYLSQINRIRDQALQLQMNPHFIFNSLNAIQGFIGTDEEEKAMNFLARFARLIRLIFEHSKGNSISLDKEIEFIQLYLDLEKLRFKEKVNVRLKIDPALEEMRDLVSVPPLLIQPIVENSFKHGLFHKKGIGNLSIDYILESENQMMIIVEDDGIGRAKAAEIKKPSGDQHVSSGIKTTKERISLMNFEKNEDLNSIRVEDLYTSDGQSAGTKTIIRIAI